MRALRRFRFTRLKERRFPFFALHVLLPIVLGGLIYICWRPQDLLMFRWLRAAGVESLINSLRAIAAPFRAIIPHWIVYSLPDGLWVYALTAFMIIRWRDRDSLTKLFWLSTGLLLGVGSELGQLAGIVPGSFDYSDLIVCLLAPTAAIIFTSGRFSFRFISQRSLNETSTKSFVFSSRRRRFPAAGAGDRA